MTGNRISDAIFRADLPWDQLPWDQQAQLIIMVQYVRRDLSQAGKFSNGKQGVPSF